MASWPGGTLGPGLCHSDGGHAGHGDAEALIDRFVLEAQALFGNWNSVRNGTDLRFAQHSGRADPDDNAQIERSAYVAVFYNPCGEGGNVHQ